MSAMQHAGQVDVFKARSNSALAVLLWAAAAFGIVVTVVQTGLPGLRFAAPLVLMAFAGWALFWRPAVVVSDAGVELVNPLRRIGVPWEALAFVDTKYALTLVTGSGRFASWAAPAPGMWGARGARPQHLTGLPESSYGPEHSVRPGDLTHTVSGQAALLVRRRWAEQVERGAVAGGRADETPVLRRAEWGIVAATLVLVAATIVTLAA
ncbi:PH domain-containing protein [Sinomonas sp. ASV322]|uniref:PH domain-containing protein n=1 Tax=Sinomonas sp. ASV322 TaxID=3041920 RepID=UPI0027DAD47A|nr:PH domain-containing protein [Sinomonas sp. ASV322]MDQ4501989.1 PH domain-containing protein [Sinomonas sp. ASV322]